MTELSTQTSKTVKHGLRSLSQYGSTGIAVFINEIHKLNERDALATTATRIELIRQFIV